MAGMTWFWIYGIKEGRAFRAGPYADRGQANTLGIQWCGSEFEVFEFDTRDDAEAGKRIKHILASRGMPIGNALQRQRVQRETIEDDDGGWP